MVTTQSEAIDGKFSFARITRRFRISRHSKEKEKPARKKFSLSKFFRREKQPDIQFESGYGEL
jgi:hypothetical protein